MQPAALVAAAGRVGLVDPTGHILCGAKPLRGLGAVELPVQVGDGHTLFAELDVCGWRDWRRLADHALQVFAVVQDRSDVGAGARDLERGPGLI